MAWYVDELKAVDSVIAGQTNAVISKVFSPKEGTSPLVVDVKVSGYVGACTISLQDSSDGFTTTNTKSKTVAVSADGTFSITLIPELAGDQTNYPLRNSMRVVITTTTDAITIDSVRVLVER